ncbi:hypothetical protein NOF04DRAFT_22373 [Fusarium oxysporum II5]|uniref:Uncharacterized protein n=2 Tax=Fusarium oxysporum species complex TaxID=171631 RepID=X0K269_FUSO5|nr:uncharacterized protein FOIG_06913 [Fusarium odoratissimum NRRL 54006]EXM02787.1 hypothetical protein FOIG_06913 [Fusarium odoratissimum NRRL 54006]KAK2133390.1 hypothetical protein NOF04DRAFT_22373 [Fusarium oxysporum II5]TXC07920.1 hypothetical protein FocTR4_00003581 [Fusarium oxysporum f. sp. cubense]
MLRMTSTSSETELFTTPPTSPSQITTCQLPGRLLVQPCFLELEFDKSRFSLPTTARGICCSAKNVWYSNHHWPEQSQYKHLFEQASETWEKLAPEFNRIWNKIWRRSLATTPWTVELRLAGVHLPNEQRIIIKPSIWIRSTDEAIRSSTVWKRLQKEVRKLGLDSVQYALTFAEGGLRSANGPASVPLERLSLTKGIELSHGASLHTHVTWWTVSMPYECGEVCLTTIVKDGRIVYQEVSRIGGVLVINASLAAGVTSGHTMLLYFLQNTDEVTPMDGNDLQSTPQSSDSNSCSEDDDGKASSDECELVENDTNSPDPISDLGYIGLEKVGSWVPVTLSGMINFIQQAEVPLSPEEPYLKLVSISTGPIPADFALVSRQEFGVPLGHNDNIYNFNGRKNVSNMCPDSWLAANEHEILVLLGNGIEGSAGFLQPAKLPFSVGSTTIWTRKIRLTAPLGRGTSGSWVVLRDSGRLCGSIIAVFEREPYALMITAQTLFSDIIQYSRDVRLVTLGSPKLDLKDEGQALVFNDLGHEVGLRDVNKEEHISSSAVKSNWAMEDSIAAPEEPPIASQLLACSPTPTAPSHRRPHMANSLGNNPGSLTYSGSSDTGSSEFLPMPQNQSLSDTRMEMWSPDDNVIARISAKVISGTKFDFTTIMDLESEISETQPSASLLRFPDTSRADSALMGCGSVFGQFIPSGQIYFSL